MSFLVNQPFLWMDSGIYRESPLEPLSRDEALAAQMKRDGAAPILHLWVYDKALYLGRRDAKLPGWRTLYAILDSKALAVCCGLPAAPVSRSMLVC